MENPRQFSRLDSVPQHIPAHIQHLVPSTYLTEFNASPFTTGHCLLPQLASGSLPPAVSNQQIHQPSLNPSLSGFSTLTSQGLLIERSSTSFSLIHSFILLKDVNVRGMCILTWYGPVNSYPCVTPRICFLQKLSVNSHLSIATQLLCILFLF